MDIETATTTDSSSAYDLPLSKSPSTNRPPGGRKRRLAPRRSSRHNPEEHTIAPPSKGRRSARGSSSLWDLARHVQEGKKVVFITGAGLSVASGVKPFRTTNSSHDQYSRDSSWKSEPSASSKTKTTGSGSSGNKLRKKVVSATATKKRLVEEQPLGIWNSVLWTQAKRETFRKDPLVWWNDFWLEYFPVVDYENKYRPNKGHLTLAALQRHFPESVKIITQNVDGLQQQALDKEEVDKARAGELKDNIIEAHGRLGLYKCVPVDDSDTDSSSDEDDDRLVHLGHRRKYRAWKQKHKTNIQQQNRNIIQTRNRDPPARGERERTRCTFRRVRAMDPLAKKLDPPAGNDSDPPISVVSTDVSCGSSMSDGGYTCKYQMVSSLAVNQLEPPCVRETLLPPKLVIQNGRSVLADADKIDEATGKPISRRLTVAPTCPTCGNKVLPQALLFDEGYHSHDHYNFQKMEDWLEEAEVLVFIGTSFAVTLPLVALDHARETGIPVFNFNVSDMLDSSRRLNAENITGPSQVTLPKLLQAIQYLEDEEGD